MVEKGQVLKVKTTTRNDVFGTCWWEVAETGLQAPEKERRETERDGVKCVMLCGTGPSARPGYTVIDSQFRIANDIAAGICQVVPRSSVPTGKPSASSNDPEGVRPGANPKGLEETRPGANPRSRGASRPGASGCVEV